VNDAKERTDGDPEGTEARLRKEDEGMQVHAELMRAKAQDVLGAEIPIMSETESAEKYNDAVKAGRSLAPADGSGAEELKTSRMQLLRDLLPSQQFERVFRDNLRFLRSKDVNSSEFFDFVKDMFERAAPMLESSA